MESSRLKTIIILILTLLNLCLLAVLAGRRADQDNVQQQARQQLSSLFSAAGIRLEDEQISDRTPPSSRSFLRSSAQEKELAEFLLGSITASEQSSSASTYTGNNGSAVFHDNGAFEAAGSLSDDGDAFCTSFCKTFSYQGLTFSDDGTSAAATLYREGYPVWNCTVTFTLSGDGVTGVAGTYLPSKSVELAADVTPLSAAAALTAVLETCRTSGAAISQITEVSPCYEYQSTLTAPMTVTPAWRVCTDIDGLSYTVNCSTGVVTVS